MRKKDRDLVSRVLLLALFGGLFLMMGTIDEAEAWLMHQTNCKTIAEAKIEASKQKCSPTTSETASPIFLFYI